MVCYTLPTVSFKVILAGTRTMARRVSYGIGQQLPPLLCFMDDVMNLPQTAACMTQLLKRLKEPVTCAKMKIKPAKPCSLSIRMGSEVDTDSIQVAEIKIPVHAEQPTRCLGREYTADLTDKHIAAAVLAQLKGTEED